MKEDSRGPQKLLLSELPSVALPEDLQQHGTLHCLDLPVGSDRLLQLAMEDPDASGLADYHEQKNNLPALLTALLLISHSESNLPMPESVTLWKRGNNQIDVQTGDLFHFGFENRHRKKNIIVIPVNTAFDTHVTRKIEGETFPLVSENTIHGQWLLRLEKSGEQLDLIDARISESLKVAGFIPEKKSDSNNGKKDCYPIGSVAMIEIANAVYFLIAMAEFDNFNNAQSSSDKIDTALQSLLTIYDRFGLGYDLYLPLMGTGLSRAGLSAQAAYDLLIHCLIENSEKIRGHIHIVLRPSDRSEIILQRED